MRLHGLCGKRVRPFSLRHSGSLSSMRMLALSALVASVAAQWPQLCPDQQGFSAWNETRCPSGASCAPNAFSVTGWGCSPFPNATICNSYQTCPQGSTCTLISGSSYSEVYACTGSSSSVISLCTCKPGVPLPLDPTRKNVIIIGDSLTIGYTPVVASLLVRVFVFCLPRFMFALLCDCCTG